MTHVKICGITSVEDALACVRLGASAIGVNFVATSPRRVTVERAREIARAVGTGALVVGVVADLDVAAMKELKRDAELGCLQLHGDEPPVALVELLPHAYKVLRVAGAADVARAAAFPGNHVMADARLEGALGGTGKTFDWRLVVDLARARRLTVAGGLVPENVGAAVRAVRPFAVDVASGVETAPGKKDLTRVEAFLDAVRAADGEP